MVPMLKTKAIELLGGTTTAAAAAIGVTSQAVAGWPDELPPRIKDRVLAALYRQQHGDKLPKPAQVKAA
jgi:NaMN:DMB phosphoribosyltransferase